MFILLRGSAITVNDFELYSVLTVSSEYVISFKIETQLTLQAKQYHTLNGARVQALNLTLLGSPS